MVVLLCTLDATLAGYVKGTMVGRELTRSCDCCEIAFFSFCFAGFVFPCFLFVALVVEVLVLIIGIHTISHT